MYLMLHYSLKMLVWAPLNQFHDPLGWWPTEWSKDPVWSVFQDVHKYLVVYVLCLVSEIVSAIFWIRKHWRRQEKAGALRIQSPCFGNMLERCSFISSQHHTFDLTSPRLFLILSDPALVSSSTWCSPRLPWASCTTPSARPHPRTGLQASTHSPALLGLIWQSSSQEPKPCH